MKIPEPPLNLFGKHAELCKCGKMFSWEPGGKRPRYCKNCGIRVPQACSKKEGEKLVKKYKEFNGY